MHCCQPNPQQQKKPGPNFNHLFGWVSSNFYVLFLVWTFHFFFSNSKFQHPWNISHIWIKNQQNLLCSSFLRKFPQPKMKKKIKTKTKIVSSQIRKKGLWGINFYNSNSKYFVKKKKLNLKKKLHKKLKTTTLSFVIFIIVFQHTCYYLVPLQKKTLIYSPLPTCKNK